jgi:hypothetical protein
MDNQQAIGKIAGLYLGEGHFSVAKWQRGSGKWQFQSEIGFSNNDPVLINFICDWLDNLEIRFHMSQNANGCWQVKVQRYDHLLKMLDILEPHLMGRKKAEAALVRRFATRRIELCGPRDQRKGGKTVPYDQEDHRIVDERLVLRESPETLSIPRFSLVAEREDIVRSA